MMLDAKTIAILSAVAQFFGLIVDDVIRIAEGEAVKLDTRPLPDAAGDMLDAREEALSREP